MEIAFFRDSTGKMKITSLFDHSEDSEIVLSSMTTTSKLPFSQNSIGKMKIDPLLDPL